MIYEFFLARPAFVTVDDACESMRRFKKLAKRIATFTDIARTPRWFFRHALKIIPLREV
jgi:hypothetical protein